MSQFFQFEADFVESLRCIPMQVRLKLDTCGIKLKLPQWHSFTQEERETLVNLVCVTPEEIKQYRQYLQNLVLIHTGQTASELAIEPHPPWLNETVIPDDVKTKAQELQINLTLTNWENLTPEQRFALIKLSRSSHENKNFLPALQEFNII